MSKHSVQSSNNGVTVRVGAGESIQQNCNTTDVIVTYAGDTATHDHLVISDTGNVLFQETYRPNKSKSQFELVPRAVYMPYYFKKRSLK